MRTTIVPFELTKRHPLTISRGTITGSTNLLVRVEHDATTGWGEMAPGEPDATPLAEADLAGWIEPLEALEPWELDRVATVLEPHGWHEAARAEARAALDVAMHDWIGKRAGLPLWKMWGLDTTRIVPTSVTIGINPPAVVRERVPEVLARTGTRVLKVKLGSPSGTEADQAMFAAAQEAAAVTVGDGGAPVAWRVDANGGWSPADAVRMIAWLADRGVDYVEQPLARGREADLRYVFARRALPIYADESVRVASDVPPLADRVDGVNLKLMKTGGLAEARRVIATARAHRLGVMIGCMGESSLSITAGAHLGSLMDHIDLDSHLNLLDDPFVGAAWCDGRVLPNDEPGLGVHRLDDQGATR